MGLVVRCSACARATTVHWFLAVRRGCLLRSTGPWLSQFFLELCQDRHVSWTEQQLCTCSGFGGSCASIFDELRPGLVLLAVNNIPLVLGSLLSFKHGMSRGQPNQGMPGRSLAGRLARYDWLCKADQRALQTCGSCTGLHCATFSYSTSFRLPFRI